MQARHSLGHRFAGLVSDALIFVAPSLRIGCTARYFGVRLDDRSLIPGGSPACPPARVGDWLAVHQRERRF
jgi:hypothetical protein